MMRGGVERVMVNGRMVYQAVPASLRPDLLALTQRAFLDEDAIVRQNIVKVPHVPTRSTFSPHDGKAFAGFGSWSFARCS